MNLDILSFRFVQFGSFIIVKIIFSTTFSNRDILACSPTGYGKSFRYPALHITCHKLTRVNKDMRCENPMALVMSPLVAIIVNHWKTLQSMGVAAANVSVSIAFLTWDYFARARLLQPGLSTAQDNCGLFKEIQTSQSVFSPIPDW